MSFRVENISDDSNLVGVLVPENTRVLIVNNMKLKSFVGCPQGIVEIVAYSNYLSDFEGLPSTIKRLDISNNNYTSLDGCPESIEELRCSKNKIVSLNGLANLTKLRSLGCSHTHIVSFVGCPQSVIKIVAAFTKLETLIGCPKTMDILYASYNKIRNLEYCPSAKILDLSCNLLVNINGLPDDVEEFCISNNFDLREMPSSLPLTLRTFRCSGCLNLNVNIYSLMPAKIVLVECCKNPFHDFSNDWLQRLSLLGVEIIC